jgi:hypothetical protein
MQRERERQREREIIFLITLGKASEDANPPLIIHERRCLAIQVLATMPAVDWAL